MNLETTALPWQAVLQELSLMRTRKDWATSLEYLGCQLAEAERCWFLTFDEQHQALRPASGDSHSAPESTLVGAAWLNSEVVQWKEPGAFLVSGVEASCPCFALPIRSYGKVIGLLTLEKVSELTDLEGWNTLLAQVAHSWDTVGRLEDHAAYQQETESLLTGALEALPSYRAGHVRRVAEMASELGRLLDLSAHQRQRLYRAGIYHDVGVLLSAVQHAQAGAQYLRAGRVYADLAELVEHHHDRYPGSADLGLEIWVLALAEHFQEVCEADERALEPEVRVQRFALQHGREHHPAVLDALVGLSVAGKLESLLP